MPRPRLLCCSLGPRQNHPGSLGMEKLEAGDAVLNGAGAAGEQRTTGDQGVRTALRALAAGRAVEERYSAVLP